MNGVEKAILQQHYKLRKLVKIWRAIARRWRDAELVAVARNYHIFADEFEPDQMGNRMGNG